MTSLLILFVIIAGIVMSAFFSAYETGVYCLNRARLRLKLEQGDNSARGVDALLKNIHHLVGTTLVGTNLSTYLASSAMTALLALWQASESRAELLATVILAPVMFVFSEVLPKNYSRKHADTVAYRCYRVIRFFHWVFYIPMFIVTGLGRLLTAAIGGKGPDEKLSLDESDLLFYIAEGLDSGQLSPFQNLAARNVLALTNKTLKDIMAPIDRVASVPDTATVGQVKPIVGEKRLSRLPIYHERPDRIIGKLHVLDLPFRNGDDRPVMDYMRPVIRLPHDTRIDAALTKLQAARAQMAVVTAGKEKDSPAIGIITLKDIVEEIVGELRVW